MKIEHLKHNEINLMKWDQTIHHSFNQFCYAFSWYLDIVSPDWEALVSHNYEFVMPLPVKRKFGISYIVQPTLTQQLGIFSKKTITEEIASAFINKIPYYSYEMNLNEYNHNSKISELPNYVLDLEKDYDDIYSHFSKNTIRNIEKAKKLEITIEKNIDIEDFIIFYNSIEKTYSSASDSILVSLLNTGKTKGNILISGSINSKGNLISALCLLVTDKRIIYLLPISNEEGKKSSSMFLQVDQIIRENAGKNNLLLDFEGSKIDGIARFYKSFGAKNQPYYLLKKFRPDFLVGKI